MAKKVSNFSDLIHRVTASCLLHPLGSNRFSNVQMTPDHRFLYPRDDDLLKSKLSKQQHFDDDDYQNYCSSCTDDDDDQVEEEEESGEIYEDAKEDEDHVNGGCGGPMYKYSNGGGGEMGLVLEQVFDAVSAMKKAYGKLQAAHSPWDPEKMRVADGEVVAELRKLAVLRERFRRGGRMKGRRVKAARAAETVVEVVAPYEAAVEELKREVKVKESELEELRSKVSVLSLSNNGKRNGKVLSKKKGGSFVLTQGSPYPTPDMFEGTMSQVRETSKSFTNHLLSLMRSAHWDISAAVRSIEGAISSKGSANVSASNTHQYQPKHALESYILRKIFQGFDHETFYMDGTLSSILNPSQFRKDCFSKFRDMKSMDPSELLGILPSSPFGVFCSKKYQDIVHPKMEESLFGNLDQRNQLFSGTHPRTQFYSDFLGLAKSVWLLHLLAFSLDPPPSHFEATRGAEFHPDYMESVLRFPGGNVPPGQIVAFPVSPGFKLGNGSVVKARVYLIPRS